MTTHNPSGDAWAHQKSKQWFEAIIFHGGQKMPFFSGALIDHLCPQERMDSTERRMPKGEQPKMRRTDR
jgi:hypothetical protein